MPCGRQERVNQGVRPFPREPAPEQHFTGHPAAFDRKAPEHPYYRRYRDRNRVELMFGFLNLAAAKLWLKHFVTAT